MNKEEYTVAERRRYNAAYGRLQQMFWPDAADAGEFRRALCKELETSFPIDWPGADGFTLLHSGVYTISTVRAGLPQVLIDAGADVNERTYSGRTPLYFACNDYVFYGEPQSLAVINALLAAGARPELDESWISDCWVKPDQQARNDWLAVYIAAWPERRAAVERAGCDAPAFDYSL